MERRSHLIEELIKADPTYRPPGDYRPAKKHRKIFIPQKDYPGYNFIGLIIGPRGNTQKRMQKETNTKIAIRGKGSVKEGAARDPKYDYGEDEELHVLITGDTNDDVRSAWPLLPVHAAQDITCLRGHLFARSLCGLVHMCLWAHKNCCASVCKPQDGAWCL